ncbi:MAG: DNA mismatch repair protein MutS [Clostridia bacterium]|nr:DNA mismatch repair protein MutS [Clostridia bacterium]
MAELTPMMRQYMDIKEQNRDAILMYRLGDFYEMFFDDAQTAARELDLVLTGRDCGLEERAPMCGVPYHAVDSYIGRLVDKGYKVAVCEQLEDPKTAKGLVKRGITRIVTAGTLTSPEMLKEDENNYLMVIAADKDTYGISWCDVSTGEFSYQDRLSLRDLANEILRLHPREVLMTESQIRTLPPELEAAFSAAGTVRTGAPDWLIRDQGARETLEHHFAVRSLASFDANVMTPGLRAAGALLGHLHETQKNSLAHITALRPVRRQSFMMLDASAVRNLELVETIAEGKRRGSLLWLLDRTRTAAGGRLLRRTILEPLLRRDDINRRLDAVETLNRDPVLLGQIRQALDGVRDLERILSRLAYGTLDARDALALRQSFAALPALKDAVSAAPGTALADLCADLDVMADLHSLLDRALLDEAPPSITDGKLLRKGYSEELDSLIELADSGMEKLVELETREKEKTGIRTLRVKYNRVFGYFIEVSKGALGSVPDYYHRKQTLANGERYVTDELKALEESLLSASERRAELEYALFLEIRTVLRENVARIQKTARAAAQLDVLQSLAQAAYENNYVRPRITDDGVIDIRGGRHPVVEKLVRRSFVPNDACLDVRDNRLLVITGPNMAGKSTFMRQTGLIVLMAHLGSFVPAESASVCLVDRIFTRVGASDDLASGQSTFMVEMNELAGILHNATSRSLLILDEIGRGTSTSDGLAIARASAEYILDTTGAKALFATHYHELISLAEERSGAQNYSVAVKEIGQDIIFLHHIVPGGTDRSFGIEVARLAGLPADVIARSREILRQLQGEPIKTLVDAAPVLGDCPEALQRILEVNLDTLAPLEALNLIYTLKQQLKERGEN